MLCEVYNHVRLPLAFRVTCRKLREVHPEKTKTKLVEVVRNTALFNWALPCLQGWPVITGALAAAVAAAGNVDVMKVLAAMPGGVIENDGPRDVSMAAAKNGHLDMIKYLHVDLQLRIPRMVGYATAMRGHIKVFKYLDKKVHGHDKAQVAIHAAKGGQLGFLQWLYRKVTMDDMATLKQVATYVARKGHADIVYWVCSLVSPTNWPVGFGAPLICREVASGGLLDLLKYLVVYGLDWPSDDDYMLSCAIESGNLDVVKFVLAHGDEWSVVPTMCAAAGGHLEILKHAHAQGFRMHADEVRGTASRYGQLETLKWSTALDRHFDKAFWLSQMLHGTYAISDVHDETIAWLKGETP